MDYRLTDITYFALALLAVACTANAAGIPSKENASVKRLIDKRSTFCPVSSQCVPLSSCPILKNLINNQCLTANSISDLSCGYQGSGLVCCPQVPTTASTDGTGPAKMVDGQRCGISQVQGESYDGLGAYPWVARVGFKNVLTGETKYPCTGSIISSRVILTAAHCALAKAENFKLPVSMGMMETWSKRLPGMILVQTIDIYVDCSKGSAKQKYAIRIGEWMTDTDIDCGDEFCGLPAQDLPISHVVVHPGYQKHTFQNNIALIVLKNKINYTVTAQPICLPESWSVTGNNGILVGWGKTAGQTVTPSYQQVLHLPIISVQNCERVYGRTLPVSLEENVCAGGEVGNDACSGFGGAPLAVKHADTFYQVGILSFGSDQCGANGIPSVYTNIKKYITWIKENTPVDYN